MTAEAILPVLTPFQFGPLSLANRAVVAPMTRVSATPDGVPTSRMVDYYREFARGGFALIIAEGTYLDHDASRGYDNQPGIADETQREAWARIATAVHEDDGRIILQLMHAGALSQRTLKGGRTIAPSRIQPRGEMMPEYGGFGAYPTPDEMTRADLVAVRDSFAAAAVRAQEAGFDGVEVHAANGYLLDQFITAYTNTRSDEYGGDAAGRIRYPAEVVAAVRAAANDAFVVGVRVSEAKVNDFTYRWPGGPAEAQTIFEKLAEAGASYLHLAGEGRGFRETLEKATESYGALARRLTGLPIIVNGGLHEPELSDAVVGGGHGDLIAIGRSALVNPDWPRRVAAGASLDLFDPAMLSPRANLENSNRWWRSRRERGSQRTRADVRLRDTSALQRVEVS